MIENKRKEISCENCKWNSVDTLTNGENEDYCHPPFLSGLLSVPCKERVEKQPKQCLWLNNKITYAEMLGNEYAYSGMDFKF